MGLGFSPITLTSQKIFPRNLLSFTLSHLRRVKRVSTLSEAISISYLTWMNTIGIHKDSPL